VRIFGADRRRYLTSDREARETVRRGERGFRGPEAPGQAPILPYRLTSCQSRNQATKRGTPSERGVLGA
jgi:hypothetical protein